MNLYHTDPDAPVPARGSPISRVAPTVLPFAGSVVTALENKSFGGAGTINVTPMLTAPFAPPTPSTCTEYVVRAVTPNVAHDVVSPEAQLSLLDTSVRLLTAVPVYTASSVS